VPVTVAVRSRALGPAAGGIRLTRYPTWRDGLTGALRLAGGPLTPELRATALADLGELIASFEGSYPGGPGLGTGPADMIAGSLAAEGVTWVPDFVASAGGVVYTLTREADGLTHEAALAGGGHRDHGDHAAGHRRRERHHPTGGRPRAGGTPPAHPRPRPEPPLAAPAVAQGHPRRDAGRSEATGQGLSGVAGTVAGASGCGHAASPCPIARAVLPLWAPDGRSDQPGFANTGRQPEER
jgi:hypothetical protein